MGLTLGEKEHWKERISRRIDHRVDTLVGKQDPTFLQRVAGQAEDRAYASLGIDAQRRELERIQKQQEDLRRRERRLLAEEYAIVQGTKVDEELDGGAGQHEWAVEQAVKARAKVLEAEILTETDLGKQVLALRGEKDNLLDTVWLATSSSQIKELWEQVNQLLGVSPTALEEKALRIVPPPEV